ncbi:hypothetical protein [Nocardia nova]|uniref:hypothetical protein n=1 Tax=Nocardia nova TaxID=37330 RepID=UPI0011B0AF0D|nr:hypothetical protein [Nocardia nova]
MPAYLGKTPCTELDHRREVGADGCLDWHCHHCDGPASPMGVCDARCRGQQADDAEFNQMVAALRANPSGSSPK